MLKIYVASSWKNPYQPKAVRLLRAMGHEVYDFRNAAGRPGFQWSQVDDNWRNWTTRDFQAGLKHPVAEAGFRHDFDAMQWADVCVLVLPCGRSAHSEAGWMKGSGRRVIVWQWEPEEPELMYKLFDGVCSSAEEAQRLLESFEK